MGKRTILYAQLDVVPNATPKQGGKEGEIEGGKQLIFTDFDGGEIILYPMSEKLAKQIGTRLKMSNKALIGELEAERRRAEAQERLGVSGGANGTMTPETQVAAQDIMRGVHVKEEGET